jgi:hypothetical protein
MLGFMLTRIDTSGPHFYETGKYMYDIRDLEARKHNLETPRILPLGILQTLSHLVRSVGNVGEFRQFARQTICNFRLLLREPLFLLPASRSSLSDAYQLHCLGLCRETNGTDLHIFDYRNDAKLPSYMGYLQKLFHTLRDEIESLCCSTTLYHIPFYRNVLSIPSILIRCKKFENSLYLLFPRIAQYLSVYNWFAFEPPSSCAIPRRSRSVRGTLFSQL